MARVCIFGDGIVFGLLSNEDLEPDGLHPGSDGHQKLFDAIAPAVFALSALNRG